MEELVSILELHHPNDLIFDIFIGDGENLLLEVELIDEELRPLFFRHLL